MKLNYKKLGLYIKNIDKRNKDGKIENLLGVSVQKVFIPSIANTIGTDFSKYKIVKKGQFTYIPDTSRRGDKIGIALLKDYEEGVVSNIYTVFEIIDEGKLNPEYLMLWFSRPEFDRYARYMSIGSVREVFSWEDMCNVELPVPDIEQQRKIVWMYQTIEKRIKLKEDINDNLLKISNLLYLNSFPYSIYDNLPKGWRIDNLGEIISIHDSKRIPLSGNQRDSMKNKIYPYYGAASLMDYVENFIFDGKYLLVGEDGTVVDNKGFPILQYVWGKFWVNNHAHILTGKNGFNVESLFILLKHTNVTNIVTGAVQPKISQTNLKSVPIVIPPLEHIEKYNDTILPIFKKIRANSEENEYLVNLREVLLAKLFSAEIDLSNI